LVTGLLSVVVLFEVKGQSPKLARCISATDAFILYWDKSGGGIHIMDTRPWLHAGVIQTIGATMTRQAVFSIEEKMPECPEQVY
jgi:hypothetical protein